MHTDVRDLNSQTIGEAHSLVWRGKLFPLEEEAQGDFLCLLQKPAVSGIS